MSAQLPQNKAYDEGNKMNGPESPVSSADLVLQLGRMDPTSAAEHIELLDTALSVAALRTMGAQTANEILPLLSHATRERIVEALPSTVRLQWELNESFPEGSIGRMMDPPIAVFGPDMSVHETIEVLRTLVKTDFITYGYVVDPDLKLIGVLVMRDLLFADPGSALRDVMLQNPFSLKADMPLMEAMREVLTRHFPVYPVSNDKGELAGLVRGHRLFEAQAVEISAQAGSMVGVEKEEKLSTPWTRSFKYRHPWLQLNLLTAFIAGGVVSFFQGTIDQMVVLAAFLPVLAGQSGNTGCQALAVTLRGMTFQEYQPHEVRQLLIKEGLLGFLNGAFVGISAAVGMYLLASSQGNPLAFQLSLIVFVAMIGSCFVSGLSGALIPLILRRLGADPATASSIFLTTATDVCSMGLLLSLASWALL